MREPETSPAGQLAPDDAPRTVSVFLDGTWNKKETEAPTNVRKLYEATVSGFHDGRHHAKLYIPGVGSRPTADGQGLLDELYEAHLAAHLDKEFGAGADLLRRSGGGLFGKGTKARIKAAYHTVCHNFVESRGDKLFIFGFSRGAFAARSLSGFIETVGLLLSCMVYEVDQAYELYESSSDATQSRLKKWLYDLTGQAVVNSESAFYLPLHFVGVWDTVGSLGLPGRHEWLSAPFTEYHQARVPSNVSHARHALALHELRKNFEPLLWQDSGHPSMKQVWFAGAHADVGGGYPLTESGLSSLALKWMANEAEGKGLRVDQVNPWLAMPSAIDKVHHEIRGMFLASYPKLREWLLQRQPQTTDPCYFHESVRDRLAKPDCPPEYPYFLPCVRNALRRVDETTPPLMVLSALQGKGVIK